MDLLCGNCSVLKVLKIDEAQFTEVCNLRIREMVNLSYSATDVAWSPLEGFTCCCLLTLCCIMKTNSYGML